MNGFNTVKVNNEKVSKIKKMNFPEYVKTIQDRCDLALQYFMDNVSSVNLEKDKLIFKTKGTKRDGRKK